MVEAEAAKGLDVGDVGIAIVAGETSSVYGLVVSSVVSLILAPPTMSCEGRHAVLPFMERPAGVSCSHYSPFG